MIFRELSNAAFRFSLRRPGAEIMGRRSTPPPPQQTVENPEAQQSAGYRNSGWLSGHLRAGESERPAAAAPYVTVIPPKFLMVPGFDHRTFDSIKKMMVRFSL